MENNNTATATKTLAERIQTAYDATEPFTKARRNALAKIKWVLRDQFGEYVAETASLADGIQMTADAAKARVFDGRDNEVIKLRFYQGVTGLTFAIEVL